MAVIPRLILFRIHSVGPSFGLLFFVTIIPLLILQIDGQGPNRHIQEQFSRGVYLPAKGMDENQVSKFQLRGPREASIGSTGSIYPLLEEDTKSLDGILVVRLSATETILVIRSGKHAVGLEYQPNGGNVGSGSWKKLWSNPIFPSATPTGLFRNLHPWAALDILGNGKDSILIRNEGGLQFYNVQRSGSGLELVNEDGQFADAYNWADGKTHIFLWGRFYSDTSFVGLLTRNAGRQIKFYVVDADKLKQKEEEEEGEEEGGGAVAEMEEAITITKSSSWTNPTTQFYLADLKGEGQQYILLRTTTGLEIYRFDSEYDLHLVLRTSLLALNGNSTRLDEDKDSLFFPRLTALHPSGRSIVHLTKDLGLCTYKFDPSSSSLQLVDCNSSFAHVNGWRSIHTESVQVLDLNGDGSDDLLFSGVKGLTALSFGVSDSARNSSASWSVSLLDPDSVDASSRFTAVIGAVPPSRPSIPDPLIFMMDVQERISCGSLIPSQILRTTTEVPTTPRAPTLETITTDVQWTVPPNSDRSLNTKFEKRQMRWIDRWDTEFLKEAVNSMTRQIQFRIPLVQETYPLGLSIDVGLRYDSGEAQGSSSGSTSTTSLLGRGWSLDLVDNFIGVNRGSSIFPEDFRYFLSVEGKAQKLRMLKREEYFSPDFEGFESILNIPEVLVDIKNAPRFVLAQKSKSKSKLTSKSKDESKSKSKILFTYLTQFELWIVESETEKAIYGRGRKTLEQDQGEDESAKNSAVQWSLSWPTWRGSVRLSEVGNLEPLPLAWYLVERHSKNSEHSLFFKYQVDPSTISGSAKSYTSEIRLLSISNGLDTVADFNYRKKTPAEYAENKVEPVKTKVDKNGELKSWIEFPTPLSSTYFLEGCSLTTSHYSHHLSFSYILDSENNARFLTGISENATQPLFQFHYKQNMFSEDASIRVLEKIEQPIRGSFLQFTLDKSQPLYQELEGPVTSLPVRDSPRIFQGPDYRIIAFQDTAMEGRIVIRVFDRWGKRQLTEVDTRVWARPRKDPAASSSTFNIIPGENHFVLLQHHKDEIALCAVYRHQDGGSENSDPNSERWVAQSDCHIFSKYTTLIPLRPATYFVILEPNETRTGFTTVSWNETSQHLEKSHVTTSSSLVSLTLLTSSTDDDDNDDDKSTGRLIGYDDRNLWLFQSTPPASANVWSWNSSILLDDPSIQAFKRNGQLALDSFSLTSETSRILKTTLDQNRLQVLNNMVVLSTLEESGGQLSIRLWALLLGADYGVESRQEFFLRRKRTSDVKYKLKQPEDTYHLEYKREGGLFKIVVKGFEGKTLEAITKNHRNRNLREDAITKYTEELNSNRPFMDSLKQLFLFDWGALFPVSVDGQSNIHVGNDTLIQYSGSGWAVKTLPPSPTTGVTSIPLGKSFILQVQPDSGSDSESRAKAARRASMSLYKQQPDRPIKTGPALLNVRVNAQKLVNRYPLYIAYEEVADQQVWVIPFKDHGKKIGSRRSFANEVLVSDSNFQSVITLRNASRATTSAHLQHFDMLSRPVHTLLSYSPLLEAVATGVKFFTTGTNSKLHERLTTFDRTLTQNSMNDTFIENIRTIPGGGRGLAGWEEISLSGSTTLEDLKKTKRVLNSDGEVVQEQKEEKQNESPDQNGKLEDSAISEDQYGGLMWDRSGNWLISDMTPYNLNGPVPVVYVGFEQYEEMESYPWLSSFGDYSTNIIRDGFSLTGSSYLRLEGGDRIVPNFRLTPAQQDKRLLAAAWIRPSKSLQLESTVNTMAAIVSVQTPIANTNTTAGNFYLPFLATVVKRERQWYYLELVLDLPVIQTVYKKYLETGGFNPEDNSLSQVNFILSVTIQSNKEDQPQIDVDHFRLTPIDLDFRATVYHDRSGQQLQVIQANGLITRTLYDDHYEEIGQVDENGKIQTFTQTTRLSSPQHFEASSFKLTMEPEDGFYEYFDRPSDHWTFPNYSSSSWTLRKPGVIQHRRNTGSSKMQIKPLIFEPLSQRSTALHFYYSLGTSTSVASLILTWGPEMALTIAKRSSTYAEANFRCNSKTIRLNFPAAAKLILMNEGSRLFVWIDRVPMADQGCSTNPGEVDWTKFTIEFQGQVEIRDLSLMINPRLQLEYFNAWGEGTQTIHLESENSVVVTETVQDQLGRPVVTTRPTRLTRTREDPLLKYYHNFVDKSTLSSSWRNDVGGNAAAPLRVGGLVHELNPQDLGFPYSRVIYDKNPLQNKVVEGSPGPEYSVGGKYAKKRKYGPSSIPFMVNLFPPSTTGGNFRHEEEYALNGSIKVSVFDKKGNRVAVYRKVPSFDHSLVIFEYDEGGNLLKILPPLYHEKMVTSRKSTPWIFGHAHLTAQEKRWQQLLGTHMRYNEQGQIISKITPEGGRVEYLYTPEGYQRFVAHFPFDSSTIFANGTLSESIVPIKVVFFNYNDDGEVTQTGHLAKPLPTSQMRQYLNVPWNDFEYYLKGSTVAIGNATDAQRFYYSEGHTNPLLRGRVKQFVTYNTYGHHNNTNLNMAEDPGEDNHTVIEKLHFNAQQQVQIKRTLVVSSSAEADPRILTDMVKTYKGHQMDSMIYPVLQENGRPFQLFYRYNKRNQLTCIGSSAQNPCSSPLARFFYDAAGQLIVEEHVPQVSNPSSSFSSSSPFNRTFSYNPAGFLETLSDPFLKESLSYNEGGYGQSGFGDGIVMYTLFDARGWSNRANGKTFEVTEDLLSSQNIPVHCLGVLQKSGHLSRRGRVLKEYNLNTDFDLTPRSCQGKAGERLSTLLSQKRRPGVYGHRYTYGSYQELVKAKYVTEDEINSSSSSAAASTPPNQQPLKSTSFSNAIPQLSPHQAKDIWDILTKAKYIYTDIQSTHVDGNLGTRGNSFIVDDLQRKLNEISTASNSNHTSHIIYSASVEKYVLKAFIEKRRITYQDFERTFLLWSGETSILLQNVKKSAAKEAFDTLINNGFLKRISGTGTTTIAEPCIEILKREFKNSLQAYATIIPDIVQVLQQHFSHKLGSSAFDVESYKIDANGNHHLFNTGFNRFQLIYPEGSNMVQEVIRDGPKDDHSSTASPARLDGRLVLSTGTKFLMQHDSNGNVVKALHKGIQKIDYNPTTQRPTRIKMVDGRTLLFSYDGQGERVLKKVLDSNGSLKEETQYLRDEAGRVLVEWRSFTGNPKTTTVITTYIYGPRGLIGFYRNREYYNVITDHAGSVRLVVQDGAVVAAYDYLPYGELMRIYGSDPDVHISYRFTGQEYDEETGLYNYHARMYDPVIGRFFQPDPKSQYFSPYKYAGNSPVSLVDPDGELAFLLTCLALAVVGAYLGGAAANNRLNPLEWDYKDPGTYVGVVGGALAGGFMPLGITASVGAIAAIPAVAALGTSAATVVGISVTTTLAVGGAYLSAATTNENWDPTKWKWDEIGTYNALFQGFSSGASLIGGAGVVHQFAGKMVKIGAWTTRGSKIFLGVSYGTGAGIGYASAAGVNGKVAFWEWDFSNPATLSSFVNGFDAAMGWPHGFTQVGRGIGKLATKVKTADFAKLLSSKTQLSMKKLGTFLKNKENPLYKMAGGMAMTYYMAMVANGNDPDITRWNFAALSTYEGILNGAFFGKDIAGMLKIKQKHFDNVKFDGGESLVKTDPNLSKPAPSPDTKTSKWMQHFVNEVKAASGKALAKTMKDLFDGKISSLDTMLTRAAQQFVQRGYDSYKKGQSKPPKDLETSLKKIGEADAETHTKKTKEWQKKVEDEETRQKEIQTDRDVEYLSCTRSGGGLGRRKRDLDHHNLTQHPTDLSSTTNHVFLTTDLQNWNKTFADEDSGERAEEEDDQHILDHQNLEGKMNPANFSFINQSLRGTEHLEQKSSLPVFSSAFVSSGSSRQEIFITSWMNAVRKGFFLVDQTPLSSLLNLNLYLDLSFLDPLFGTWKPPNPYFSPLSSEPEPETPAATVVKSFSKMNPKLSTVEFSCVPWAISDGQYVPGLSCVSPHFRSSVYQQAPLDTCARPLPMEENGGSQNQNTFNIKTCTPIYWNGVPSVTCQGEETTFIYTPSLAPRVFDYVDGWLLLSQLLAPALTRKFQRIKRWINSTTVEDVDEQNHRVEEENENHGPAPCRATLVKMVQRWEELLSEVAILVSQLKNKNQPSSWASTLLQDRRRDLDEIKSGGSSITWTDVEMFDEKVEALREDILEMFGDLEGQVNGPGNGREIPAHDDHDLTLHQDLDVGSGLVGLSPFSMATHVPSYQNKSCITYI